MALALSKDGKMVATASEKGTLIRVFSMETRKVVKQFRRGYTESIIHDLAFSNNNNYLACCSSSGTIHMFNLVDENMNTKTFGTLINEYIYGTSLEVNSDDSDNKEIDEETIKQIANRASEKYDTYNQNLVKCCFNANNDLVVMYSDGNFYYFPSDTNYKNPIHTDISN